MTSGNRLRIGVLALTVFASFAASAGATTLTFDAGAPLSSVLLWSESGFDATFTGGTFGYNGNTASCNPTCADDGTNWLGTLQSAGNPSYANTIVIKAADNSPFTFSSFMGAETFAGNGFPGGPDWAAAIRVTGVKADSTTLAQNFLLDQIDDGTGGLPDFQSFTSIFSDAFVELDFTGINTDHARDFVIDNLVVNQVPEPASLLLLGTGLIAGGRRLKRRKASA